MLFRSITGSGIVSCIGNNKKEVLDSLLNTKSGITFSEEYKKYNFKSQICGIPNIKYEELIDRKVLRFMGDGSAYAYLSMKEAIEESGLTEKEISNEKTGIIIGSGGPSIRKYDQPVQFTSETSIRSNLITDYYFAINLSEFEKERRYSGAAPTHLQSK